MEFENTVLFCSHRFQIPDSTKSLPLPVSLVCLPRFRSVSFLAVTTTGMSRSNPYFIPVQNDSELVANMCHLGDVDVVLRVHEIDPIAVI
jgi:hypothetical protein